MPQLLRRASGALKTVIVLLIYTMISISCIKNPPSQEQALAELQKLGQSLYTARQQAGRLDDHAQGASVFAAYPDKALPAAALEKMRTVLDWLKPALRGEKNQRLARLIGAQLLYEQQRQQDAQRGYRPLGQWPQSFHEDVLRRRRYRRQLAALGLVQQQIKPLYHQALRVMGDLERRAPQASGQASGAVFHLSLSEALTTTKALPAWQKHLYTQTQIQGWRLFLATHQARQKNALAVVKQAALRAAADIGVNLLAMSRARVVQMFHRHSALSDTAIDAQLRQLRLRPGQALAAWMGMHAYDDLSKDWIHKYKRDAVPVALWRWVQQQGPLDLRGIKDLAQTAPPDLPASAGQKPGPAHPDSAAN